MQAIFIMTLLEGCAIMYVTRNVHEVTVLHFHQRFEQIVLDTIERMARDAASTHKQQAHDVRFVY